MDESSVLIPVDLLAELCSRFIINVPEDERRDVVRLGFQIELAHWFYLDFCCGPENPHLRPCSMRRFTHLILKEIPGWESYAERVDDVLEPWKQYKSTVPTYGAALLDPTLEKVLLVQGFYGRSSWGFPKGKVNEMETPAACAVREVLEETGYDISDKVREEDALENEHYDQYTKLYIIPGVPTDQEFTPQTRKEIKTVEWFCIKDLPASRKDMAPKANLGLLPNSFYMVIPFVRKLREWIYRKRQQQTTLLFQLEAAESRREHQEKKRHQQQEIMHLWQEYEDVLFDPPKSADAPIQTRIFHQRGNKKHGKDLNQARRRLYDSNEKQQEAPPPQLPAEGKPTGITIHRSSLWNQFKLNYDAIFEAMAI